MEGLIRFRLGFCSNKEATDVCFEGPCFGEISW